MVAPVVGWLVFFEAELLPVLFELLLLLLPVLLELVLLFELLLLLPPELFAAAVVFSFTS